MSALQRYEGILVDYYYQGMQKKLGLTTHEADDNQLAFSLLDILMKNNMDYTRSFRALSHFSKTDKVCSLRDDCLDETVLMRGLNVIASVYNVN